MNSDLGHNLPPDMAVTAEETVRDLSGWMAENPIIENEDKAREAKVFIDRGSLCIKDLEDERTNKVKPLNEQVKEINEHYRGPRQILETVLETLKERIQSFIEQEEQKRIAAANEAARLADEAEQRAREAERIEQEALGSAGAGELGVDVAAHVVEADRAFRDYEKAAHREALAERETKVKIGGGFTRSLSLRSKEILVVVDAVAAVKDIGLGNEIIDEAIIRAARAYKKVFGKLPDGIRSEIERKV